MAKFLTGNELNSELEKLFNKAESLIVLISPYIKLHDRYISTLKTKLENPYIEVFVVFGKNEDDLSKSMKKEDFNFFKEFPNIEIRYEKRLHAKYYANEFSAILTSMNLYNFSQDNNIEAGVMSKVSHISNLANNLLTNVTGEDSFDKSTWTYFKRVIDQSELLFKKVPEFETKMFGLSEKYKSSKIEVDLLTDFFESKSKFDISKVKDNFDKKSTANSNMGMKNNQQDETISIKVSTEIKFLSTTALSKEIGIASKELFNKFEKLNWIEKFGEEWILTPLGQNMGAQTKKGQYGEYIAWPETIINEVKML